MWVRSLRVKNIKCFGDPGSTFDFAREGRPRRWTVILGTNGAGKSTLIRAIALAFMRVAAPSYFERNFPRMLRSGTQTGEIVAEFGASTSTLESNLASWTVHLELVREPKESDNVNIEDRGQTYSPVKSALGAKGGWLFCAYGPTRAVPSSTTARIRFTLPNDRARRVLTLFEECSDITLPEVWLPDFLASQNGGSKESGRASAILRTLERILHLQKGSVSKSARHKQICATVGGVEVPLGELSDGYRSLLTWSCDLLCHLCQAYPDSDDPTQEEGVVLVDELDLHLHPGWQMGVVSALKDAFPHLQFIATTHNPLCLRGLEPDEYLVLRETDRGIETLHNQDDGEYLPDVGALRTDQILLSPIFGLLTDRDLKLHGKLERYYKILAQPSRSAKDNARAAKLRAELRARRQLGSTLQEQIVLETADRVAALKALHPGDAKAFEAARAQAIRDILKAWGVGEEGSR